MPGETDHREGRARLLESQEKILKSDILVLCPERWVGICQADRVSEKDHYLIKVKGEWGWGATMWNGIQMKIFK